MLEIGQPEKQKSQTAFLSQSGHTIVSVLHYTNFLKIWSCNAKLYISIAQIAICLDSLSYFLKVAMSWKLKKTFEVLLLLTQTRIFLSKENLSLGKFISFQLTLLAQRITLLYFGINGPSKTFKIQSSKIPGADAKHYITSAQCSLTASSCLHLFHRCLLLFQL